MVPRLKKSRFKRDFVKSGIGHRSIKRVEAMFKERYKDRKHKLKSKLFVGNIEPASFKKRSEKNKANLKKLLYTSNHGTKSYVVSRYEHLDKTGVCPDLIKQFWESHTRVGQWNNPEAEVRLSANSSSSGSIDSNGPKPPLSQAAFTSRDIARAESREPRHTARAQDRSPRLQPETTSETTAESPRLQPETAAETTGPQPRQNPPKKDKPADILTQHAILPTRLPGKHPDYGGGKIKRDTTNELNWTKQSIFYELPYWSSLSLQQELQALGCPRPTSDFQVFRSLCKKSGKETIIRLGLPEMKKVIWYVLHNSPEIDAYMNEFQSERPDSDMQQEFPRWFESKIGNLYTAKDPRCTPDLFALACGPLSTATSINSCVVNGVKFVVHSRDVKRTTQNSGICSPGEKPGEMYYGQLEDILEFSYTQFKVVLFRVKWFDLAKRGRETKNKVKQLKHSMLANRRKGSVSAYVLKMKGYQDQLDCLGFPMPKVLGVSLILNSLSLSKDYEQSVMNYNMNSMGKTIVEMPTMLMLSKKGLPKKAPTAPAAAHVVRGHKVIRELEDPGCFVLPIRLEGDLTYYALADTGSNINMMPYKIYELLEWGKVKPKIDKIKMLDMSQAETMGRLLDVLCRKLKTTVANYSHTVASQ
ncbi:hypothetical protein CTI12_AA209950 [Artemisia annua]|uniref:Uncharacterized protein n=1 Tax=Artemisia annua TaxID=35608 RepID=A0A2U1NZX6_ARTAN|nr:hypothetical protein CTI12_AA209950 [Artemisia annua]